MGNVACRSNKNQTVHTVMTGLATTEQAQIQGRYLYKRRLEKTHYGEVWLGYDKVSKRLVAIKQSKRRDVEINVNSRTKQHVPEDVRFEMDLHWGITNSGNCPEGIVKVLEKKETGRFLYLVMEYADHGSLFDYLQSYQTPPSGIKWKRKIRTWFGILCESVRYLHDRNICHKDISLQNILLRSSKRGIIPMLADFGLAESFMDHNCISIRKVGKANFTSKECFDPRKTNFDAKANDVWCLGIVLFMCLTGCNCYDSPLDRACDALLRGKSGITDLLRRYRRSHLVDDMELEVLSLIFRPERKRATIHQVLQSHYCQVTRNSGMLYVR